MTHLKPQQLRRGSPFFGLLAVFAVLTAVLVGTSQLAGDSARAQSVVPLNAGHVNSVHPGDTATGTCPAPPAGQESWYGWHFVMPSNEDFATLSVTFSAAGTISADPFPGAFVSQPDSSHAYIWTPTADTLLAGSATTEATPAPGFFNLSSTCAPASAAPAETGSITIVKQGLLGEDVASFTHDLSASGSFQLGAAHGTSILFTDLAANTYHVTELPLDGYVLTGAGCSLPVGPSAASSAEAAGNTLEIVLAEGQDLVCTFVNGSTQVLQYDVTVTKYVDGKPATAGSFAMTSTWTADNLNGGVQTSRDFSLDSGLGWTAITSMMDAGAAYSVVENNIDAACDPGDDYRLLGYSVGMTLEEAVAADPAATAAITDLQADQYIVIHNESCAVAGTGSITIVKEGLAEGDAAEFTHDLPGITPASFMLTAEDNSETFESLPTGTYHFTEAALEGYELVSMGCGFSLAPSAVPETNTLTVVLGDDEDQTCTFVNVQDTNVVTVNKYVDGSPALDGSFDFIETIGGAENAFKLDAEPFSHPSAAIPFGATYTVVEDGIDGTCDEGDAYRLAGYTAGTDLDAAIAGELMDAVSIDSLEADMVVIAWNQACANVASITIVKDFQPDDEAEASFTTDGQGLEDFSIPDGAVNGRTFANLNAGTYTFTEEDIDGWKLQSIFCSGQSSPSNILINLGGASLGVTVNAGDAITCTFTNIPDDSEPEPGTGSITITKEWAGVEPGPDATFALSPNLNDDDDSVTLVDDGAGNVVSFTGLPAGTYTFDEAVIDGWDVTGINCSGIVPDFFSVNVAEGTLNVDLEDGAVASCAFTNAETSVEPGSLTIVKSWSGGEPVPTSFTVSANLGTGFTLDSTPSQEVFPDLAAGAYVVTETDLAGWTVTNIACTGGTNTLWDTDFPTGVLSVNLAAGEDIVCTFTNTMDALELGSLTIVKSWAGGEPVPTSFTVSANLGAGFTLDGTPSQEVFPDLAAGAYVVTETDLAGWTVTNIACAGGTNTLWDTDFPTGVLSVNLAAGEDIVCTFTNTMDSASAELPSIVSDFIPPFVIPANPNAPGNSAPTTGGPTTNVPGPSIVSPSPNSPAENLPPVGNAPSPPSAVSNGPVPVTLSDQAPAPMSVVAGEQSPLPPSAGDSAGTATRPQLGVIAGFATIAGAMGAAAAYAVRRR